ncbi:hypothetical protein SAMN05421681_10910 [Lysobacter enzymogenes]|nr:hypothetical protein SAMN05421681_10910 [Lysobacter enzymogenes]
MAQAYAAAPARGAACAGVAGYRRPMASGIVAGMNAPFLARIRHSRIASTAALLLSFALPFLWALSTGLVWDLGKRLPGSVSDTSIAFPSGAPLIAIVIAAWLVGFLALQRRLRGERRAVWLAGAVAVAAFCACFTWQFGSAEWNPWPEPGSVNLFPLRFAAALAMAALGSAFGAAYLTPRPAAAPAA